jgi:peptidoglycan-associated lipoprotein
MTTARALLPLVLAPLLLAATCKKKTVETTGGDDALNSPAVALQVAAIDPPTGLAGRDLRAEVLGAAFEPGAAVSVGTTATHTRFVDDGTLSVDVPPMAAGTYDVTVTNPGGVRAILRRGLVLRAEDAPSLGCSPVTVRFEYDSTVVDAEARAALDSATECLRQVPTAVRIEGHCDERGTTEYNLALGLRRADAVRRYLVGKGVSPARLDATSFGEERPVDFGSGPTAWAKNRRVEIVPRER